MMMNDTGKGEWVFFSFVQPSALNARISGSKEAIFSQDSTTKTAHSSYHVVWTSGSQTFYLQTPLIPASDLQFICVILKS